MSQPCTPTKFPASPAQLITLGLDDEIDGCALGEVLPHHLQVPSEERILDQQIPALQWLQAAVLASLANWAQAALTVVVPRPYMPRVLLLIQLLLIQLQQALCGRAEGKGAVHHREQRGQARTLQQTSCCRQEPLIQGYVLCRLLLGSSSPVSGWIQAQA